MPRMEKGRPPESKRSRKPAHPVKRGVSQEMKSFAESTMNELLGWYDYDVVDLQDSEASDISNYADRARHHHKSVLKENSDPKPIVMESKLTSGFSSPAKNGVNESSGFPVSSSSPSSSIHIKDLNNTQVIVPVIRPSSVKEQRNVQIVCVWCQKEGLKHFSLVMGSELKSFCSEKCFAMCRRAYFKRNKAQNEDQGNQSPLPPGQTVETPPQLTLQIHSNTRMCDWCKHVRHTKYLDFGAGEDRLQFCSNKCLNQYKMDIFYREAQAALKTSGPSPSQLENESSTTRESKTLLTPESWNNASLEGEHREPLSPKFSTPVLSSSLSSSVRASVLAQQKERKGSGSLHLQISTPITSAPQPHIVIEQPWVLHRTRINTQLQKTDSSPTQKSSPTSKSANTPSIHPVPPPQLLHPCVAPVISCASTYPKLIPSVLPTLGVPCPQPTVLVPYPIIVPLPVPVPIPIPIPVNSGVWDHARVIWNHKEKEKRACCILITPEASERMFEDMPENNLKTCRVKTEQNSSPESYSPPFSSYTSPNTFAQPEFSAIPPFSEVQTDEGRDCHVIQRVKQEKKTTFDLNKGKDEENGDSNEDEDSLSPHQSLKYHLSTLPATLTHTCKSPTTHVSSPSPMQGTHTSVILQKVHKICNKTTYVVAPTSAILLNNTVATSVSVPSLYSPSCISTVPSDLEHKTGSIHILAPYSEDVKENISGERESTINCSDHGEQADCHKDQSDERRGVTTDSDAFTADEHAYAQSIPPKLQEKNVQTIALTTAHTLSHMVTHSWDKSSQTHAHAVEHSGLPAETQPALKRRCLRIRDQNK